MICFENMNKKAFLDNLFYEKGKQSCNFQLAIAYKDNEGALKWSKWVEYMKAQEDEKFIEKVNNRTLLTNEIVIDLDLKINETIAQLKKRYTNTLQQLKADGYKFEAYFTGSKGYHIHLFFTKLATLKKNDREKLRGVIIEKYNGDLQKKIDKCMIALENTPHWKTGNLKELLEEVQGLNDLNNIEKEALKLEEKEEEGFDSTLQKPAIRKCLDLFCQNKEDIAERFYNEQPFFYNMTTGFWFWDNQTKCYDQVNEFQLMQNLKARGISNFQVSQNTFWTETLRALKLVGTQYEPKPFKNTWIQFNNKIFDYLTGDSFESSPEYFNCNPIPFEIGESEDTPNIDALFSEWVTEDYVQTLKETIALACLQDYPLHRIICLVGRGLNGKGVFLRFLNKFISKRNICSSNLNKLLKSNFESSKLYKKLVCQISETDFAVLRDTSLLKQLSGQDLISAEFKGRDPFDFENHATLFIASNSLPISQDRTDGFYRRWLIIRFPNQFSEGTDPLSRIQNKEYNNFARQILRLTKELILRGRFDKDGDISQRKKAYEAESDPLSKFLADNYQQDINGSVPFFQFYDAFNSFCQIRGYRELSKRAVSDLLHEKGYETLTKGIKQVDGSFKNWKMIFGFAPIASIAPRVKSTPYIESDYTVDAIGANDEKNKTSQSLINSFKILPFDSKCEAWHRCAYPIEGNPCGASPCNEFEGLWYCQDHFIAAQKQALEDEVEIR
jgi:P4 family phage/plasmid primase-like protien